MDLDVRYVRYPGLWHVWWEEGKCALGQSVVKLAAQLLTLMDKTVTAVKVAVVVVAAAVVGTAAAVSLRTVAPLPPPTATTVVSTGL